MPDDNVKSSASETALWASPSMLEHSGEYSQAQVDPGFLERAQNLCLGASQKLKGTGFCECGEEPRHGGTRSLHQQLCVSGGGAGRAESELRN